MPYANTLNRTGTYLPSLLRTSHPTATEVTNTQYKGIKIYIVVTTFTGTSITFTLSDKDPVSGVHATVLASAAIAAAAPTVPVVLTVYPGHEVTANISANKVLGRTWKITSTGTFTNATYSIGYVLLP